jgi:site-specific DNA-adenine methylase
MLSYRAEYVRSKEYEDVVKYYQVLRECPSELDKEIVTFTDHYQRIVKEKLKKKTIQFGLLVHRR